MSPPFETVCKTCFSASQNKLYMWNCGSKMKTIEVSSNYYSVDVARLVSRLICDIWNWIYIFFYSNAFSYSTPTLYSIPLHIVNVYTTNCESTYKRLTLFKRVWKQSKAKSKRARCNNNETNTQCETVTTIIWHK